MSRRLVKTNEWFGSWFWTDWVWNLFGLREWHTGLNDTSPPQNCICFQPVLFFFFFFCDKLRDPPTTGQHNYTGHFFWEAPLWKLILTGVFPVHGSQRCTTAATLTSEMVSSRELWWADLLNKTQNTMLSMLAMFNSVSKMSPEVKRTKNKDFLYNVCFSKVAHQRVSQWNTGFSQLYHEEHFEITLCYIKEDTVRVSLVYFFFRYDYNVSQRIITSQWCSQNKNYLFSFF